MTRSTCQSLRKDQKNPADTSWYYLLPAAIVNSIAHILNNGHPKALKGREIHNIGFSPMLSYRRSFSPEGATDH